MLEGQNVLGRCCDRQDASHACDVPYQRCHGECGFLFLLWITCLRDVCSLEGPYGKTKRVDAEMTVCKSLLRSIKQPSCSREKCQYDVVMGFHPFIGEPNLHSLISNHANERNLCSSVDPGIIQELVYLAWWGTKRIELPPTRSQICSRYLQECPTLSSLGVFLAKT